MTLRARATNAQGGSSVTLFVADNWAELCLKLYNCEPSPRLGPDDMLKIDEMNADGNWEIKHIADMPKQKKLFSPG
jgi:hypothetical protein